MNSGPPIFIVGCDRSGTTMLRLILDRHPELAIPPESLFITDFYHRLPSYGDLNHEQNRARLARDVLSHSRVKAWSLPLDAGDVARQIAGEHPYRRLVELLFETYARKENKRRWGDKTVHYVQWIPLLWEILPDARVVHLVRDGRDVALSLLKLPFGPANTFAAASYWQAAVRAGSGSVWHDRRGIELRYEDLVNDPEPHIRRICEFIRLDFVPNMLKIEKTGGDKFITGQAEWFGKVSEGITSSSVSKWPAQMTKRQQAVFETVAREDLLRYGYQLAEDLPPIHARSIVFRCYKFHNLLAKIIQWVRLHVISERGREIPELLRRRFQMITRRRPAAAKKADS